MEFGDQCSFYYWLHILTTLQLCLPASNGNETEIDQSLSSNYQIQYGALPPGSPRPTDPLIDLRRKYKLKDFMWTGSGDGPMPSDQDGGLAWEDNGGSAKDNEHVTDIIFVTKTMVLFKTVLTTVYSVELTPSIVRSIPELTLTTTPVLQEDSSSLLYTTSIAPTPVTIEPSPTFPVPIEPTATPYPDDQSTTTHRSEEIPTPASDTSASTNPIYWVKTVIKANASEIIPHTVLFQETMQKSLARVYASAFKRHLLNSFGLLNNKTLEQGSTRRRKRRAIGKEELDYEWLFLVQGSSNSRMRTLATTAMNVSVSIVNITGDEFLPRVSMGYIVCAEGQPIPASSAVKDMSLVSKTEMEDEIGYEVIKKAEALVSPQPVHEEISEGRTSPWVVVWVVSVCLMLVLILLLSVVVWQCKGKRHGDRRVEVEPSPQSPGIEGGVVNPAFLGPSSPTDDTSEIYHEREDTKSRDRSKKGKNEEKMQGLSSSGRSAHERNIQQGVLAKELSGILSQKENVDVFGGVEDDSYSAHEVNSENSKESSPGSASVLVKPAQATGSKGETEKHKIKEERKRDSSKTILRSPMKRLSPRKRAPTAVGRRRTVIKPEEIDPSIQQRPLSASSREKVTFGHLDICEDRVAKPISGEVKKLIQSKGGTRRGVETTISSSSTTTKTERRKVKRVREFGIELQEPIDEGTTGRVLVEMDEESNGSSLSLCEQDREIGENLDISHVRRIEIPPQTPSPKKDAQVQTPTRLRGLLKGKQKPKAKPRRFPPKMSAESLISTESEEIIEVHHIDEESSAETNPLGKMRRRFHQFLDDAFNVIGKKESEGEATRSKSAKVSLTHQIQTNESLRPWTSQVTHQESLESIRPKSASLGVPKRAWTASTERRCHSARSDSSIKSRLGRDDPKRATGVVVEEQDLSEDEPDQNSSPLSTMETSTPDGNQSFSSSSVPTFPRYPIYPDIPYPTVPGSNPDNFPGTSQRQGGPDPAVPLIQAIKEEIKRFERVKVSEHQQFHSRRST